MCVHLRVSVTTTDAAGHSAHLSVCKAGGHATIKDGAHKRCGSVLVHHAIVALVVKRIVEPKLQGTKGWGRERVFGRVLEHTHTHAHTHARTLPSVSIPRGFQCTL